MKNSSSKKKFHGRREDLFDRGGGTQISRHRGLERLFGESVRRLAQAPCEFFHDAHGDLGISFNRRFEVPERHHQRLSSGFRRDHCGGSRLLIDQSHLSKELASTQLRNQLLSLTDFDRPACYEIERNRGPSLLLYNLSSVVGPLSGERACNRLDLLPLQASKEWNLCQHFSCLRIGFLIQGLSQLTASRFCLLT